MSIHSLYRVSVELAGVNANTAYSECHFNAVLIVLCKRKKKTKSFFGIFFLFLMVMAMIIVIINGSPPQARSGIII